MRLCDSISLRTSPGNSQRGGEGTAVAVVGGCQFGVQAVFFHVQLYSGVKTFISSNRTFAAFHTIFLVVIHYHKIIGISLESLD